MTKKVFSFRLSDETMAQLAVVAKYHRRSQSNMVEVLAEEAFREMEREKKAAQLTFEGVQERDHEPVHE